MAESGGTGDNDGDLLENKEVSRSYAIMTFDFSLPTDGTWCIIEAGPSPEGPHMDAPLPLLDSPVTTTPQSSVTSRKRDNDPKYWYWYVLGEESDPTLTSRRNEEFATLTSSEAQLNFQLETLLMLGASLDMESERVKDNGRAEMFGNSGNELFSSNGDTVEAAEMYTKSIAYALPGSRELALAYANRSAVSFKAEDYEGCLLDIERTLENDYPEEMRANLYARRARCLAALEKPQTDVEKALKDTAEAFSKMELDANGRDFVEKTLTDKIHMTPTLSKNKTQKCRIRPTVPQDASCDIRGATGISIGHSEKYGRHIIATRDFRPGEIIAVMDAYANGRDPKNCYRECAHCTNKTSVGIPCDHCVNVIYCSTTCREKAWNDYHKIECPILGILYDRELPTNAIVAIRITLKAIQEAGGVVELKKMLERTDSISDPRIKGFTGNVFDCTKYAGFFTLNSHAGEQSSEESYAISLLSMFVIGILATKTEIFGQKCRPDFEVINQNPLSVFLVGLMIKNIGIVQITSLRENAQDDNVSVAPFIGLCNHSCDPNVTCMGSNKSVAFALRPIKAGEQIWDNYRHLYYMRYPKAARQKLLEKYYHFTCDCVPCTKNWSTFRELPEDLETPGLSPEARGSLIAARNAFWGKVRDKKGENLLDLKHDLVHLLELLYEHANPCLQMEMLREWLIKMYREGFDTS